MTLSGDNGVTTGFQGVLPIQAIQAATETFYGGGYYLQTIENNTTQTTTYSDTNQSWGTGMGTPSTTFDPGAFVAMQNLPFITAVAISQTAICGIVTNSINPNGNIPANDVEVVAVNNLYFSYL
jgi:hypothetical protein